MRLQKKLASALAAWRIERYLAKMAAAESVQLALAREAHSRQGNTADPLVSVTIPTFNRSQLLTERALPSVLRQTYGRIEVVVVGDHCTDETAEAVAELGDDRVRFINLSTPSQYPEKGLDRWRVAGSIPINRALFEARGEWLAYMDDDDEMVPHRIERSLEIAERSSTEFVCGQVSRQLPSGTWATNRIGPWPSGRRPFRAAGVPHSGAMYRSYLRFLLYDSRSYMIGLPTDRQWIYRLARSGVEATLVPEVFTRAPLRPQGTEASIE